MSPRVRGALHPPGGPRRAQGGGRRGILMKRREGLARGRLRRQVPALAPGLAASLGPTPPKGFSLPSPGISAAPCPSRSSAACAGPGPLVLALALGARAGANAPGVPAAGGGDRRARGRSRRSWAARPGRGPLRRRRRRAWSRRSGPACP